MLTANVQAAPVAAPVQVPVCEQRTFADLNERDLILTNGQGRIVSPFIISADIPYIYLVRAYHKSENLTLLVQVEFNGEDVIAHQFNHQTVARKMVQAVLPEYYLPIRDEWYLENRTEVPF